MAGALKAEANWLRTVAQSMLERAASLEREAGQVDTLDERDRLLRGLYALSFQRASSGKCDYCREVPGELRALFDKQGQFSDEKHHYSWTKEGHVLRFAR